MKFHLKIIMYLVTVPFITSMTVHKNNIEESLNNNEENKYWFYVRTSYGGHYDKKGFHYSQILLCSQKVSTPGAFSKSNAVGPFDSYSEASTARRDEIEIAKLSGLKLIPRQAVCDTRWD